MKNVNTYKMHRGKYKNNLDDTHTKESLIDSDLYYDLQNDHVEALRIILDGMIRRQLSRTQIVKNLSNFFYCVERVYRHYCFNNRNISLDDMNLFKLEF